MRAGRRHASPPPSTRRASTAGRRTLLCLSQSFAPDTTPTAIRASELLDRLSDDWDITVLTESHGATARARIQVEEVKSLRPARILSVLRLARLNKLLELTIWPDDSIFWLLPATRRAWALIRRARPSAIVVFMMPYSSGLAGLALARLARVPLLLNFDDSPTCTDMHPSFPTRAHYHLARAMEDFYVRHADAVVYVSHRNLQRVAERQPPAGRSKLHLVRYGADSSASPVPRSPTPDFEVVFVGGMTGWWSIIDDTRPVTIPERIYDAWTKLGRYELVKLDQRTSSPATIGRAIVKLIAAHPDWVDRLRLVIYGNDYPQVVIARALKHAGVAEVVTVHGPVAHDEVAPILARADLLFITLPRRLDGSPGGRISAKTYEYLATDRPILAAVPPGENWDYLEGRPGVWLVEPSDAERMQHIILELAAAKFAVGARTYQRDHEELSYATRARELSAILQELGTDVKTSGPTER